MSSLRRTWQLNRAHLAVNILAITDLIYLSLNPCKNREMMPSEVEPDLMILAFAFDSVFVAALSS